MHLNLQYLYEIRLRAGKPTRVTYQGEYRYLSGFGVTDRKDKGLKCTAEDIADSVYAAGKYSVYSVEEQIKQGFLTAEGGVRIGLAGEYVFEKGQPLALRNFTSLCVRIPHEIKGCAQKIYDVCMSDKVKNLLVASSPGIGKTTILRDLGRILSLKTAKNILICDERGEISNGNVGDSCDVIRFADKSTAFESGIRALRPEIMITDELSVADCDALDRAKSAGVNIIASAHFSDIRLVLPSFQRLFDRFVLLDKQVTGKIAEIYSYEGRWEKLEC